MQYSRVTVLLLSNNHFFINVPVDSNGKEMRGFRKEFINLLKEVDSPRKVSRVRKRRGIFTFDTLTKLNQEEIEILANQALNRVKR